MVANEEITGECGYIGTEARDRYRSFRFALCGMIGRIDGYVRSKKEVEDGKLIKKVISSLPSRYENERGSLQNECGLRVEFGEIFGRSEESKRMERMSVG